MARRLDGVRVVVAKSRVCIIDEHGFDDSLSDECWDWIQENIGAWGVDWEHGECWMFEDYGMTSLEFHFKRASDAMLFKLTWA